MAIMALIAVFGIMPLLNGPNHNFALLISDDPTIVDMFESIDVTIDQVKVYHEDEGWQNVLDAPATVDITQLQGNLAEQIWEGNLPTGHYTQVSVSVTTVEAVMLYEGVPVDMNITVSEDLILGIPFDIADNEVTNFVYDLTLLNPGGINYDLTPLEEESGPDQEYVIVSP